MQYREANPIDVGEFCQQAFVKSSIEICSLNSDSALHGFARINTRHGGNSGCPRCF